MIFCDKYRILKLTGLVGLTATIVLVSRISWQLNAALHQAPSPQAILVLEGSRDRIQFAAQFAQSYPHLPIWISGNPSGLELNQRIFQQAGIAPQLLNFDFCATDTVTNFTCNVEALTHRNIKHVYLITSNYHMRRSKAIATLVFGVHGIAVTPVPVSSSRDTSESSLRTIRDCIRSVVWILTGQTGARLKSAFNN